MRRRWVGVILSSLLLSGGTLLAGEGDRYLIGFPGDTPAWDIISWLGDNGKGVTLLDEVNIASVVLTDDLRAGLTRDPRVAFVEKDFTVYAFGSSRQALPVLDLSPWGIEKTFAAKVWDKNADGVLDAGAPSGKGVKLAVIDTGIDYLHPDLKDNYRGGYDYANNDADPMDDNGHGTHCSGTICAAYNKLGVVGMAPEVDLYGVKVLSAQGSGSGTAIISGINWAVKNKMQVISMSLGMGWPSTALEQACKKASDAGLVLVAASGNDGAASISYPAGYASAIAVGAVDSTLTLATFSNYGKQLWVTAPGVDVLSSVPRGTGVEASLSVGADQFSPRAAALAAPTGADGIKGPMLYAKLGKPEDFAGQNFSGVIALVQRGEINFRAKADNAKAAGCAAVIIYNNVAGPLGATMGTAIDFTVVTLDQAEGEKLLARVSAGTTEALVKVVATDYDRFAGTSMACPHVAGLAALILSGNPALTNAQVREVIKTSATDLGDAGWDAKYGWGFINAQKALTAAAAMR